MVVERALDGRGLEPRVELLYDPSVAGAGHRGVLRLLARIAREPGRERAFVEVAVLEARAGSLRAEGLREAVALARELGDEAARVALLAGAAGNCAGEYANADSAWLFAELARIKIAEGRFEPEIAPIAGVSDIACKVGRSLAILPRAAAGSSRSQRAARLYSRSRRRRADRAAGTASRCTAARGSGDHRLIESTAPLVESSG